MKLRIYATGNDENDKMAFAKILWYCAGATSPFWIADEEDTGRD